MSNAIATEALAELEAQPALQAGTEGWWKVWGARPHHARPGDILVCQDGNGGTETLYIEDTFPAKSAPMRAGLIVNGEQITIGNLAPIVLIRRGTCNTLA